MARDTDGTSTTSKKSDAWRFFHDSGRKYRTDKTHHEARCLGCLKKIDSALKKYDADQVSRGLLPRTEARTSSQLRNQAVRDLDPICGKIDALKRHITKCDDAGDAAKTWCAGEKVKEVTLKLAQETAEGNEGGVSQLPGKQKKQSVFGIVQAKSFTKKEQIEYEHNVLKLTVALNAAWRGVDIPFVRWFFDKYVPSGHLPHRQQLSSHILNEEVDTITEDIKTEVHGLYGTGSVDGWSTKKDAVQTTGLNVFGKEYPLNMHVTTPERKTSANLLQHVLKDIEIMTVTWGIVLVAWACDSGGDSKGLRRLLLEIMPWIIAIPCWAHQMNLIAGDYLIKSDSRVIDVLEQCLLVINWFLGHKRAHSMLENEQDREEWARHLTFIRAGITRWTTHYLSMRRLLELKKVLRSLVLRDEDILLTAGGDKEEQVEAAQAIIDIIEDRDFWAGVARTKIYLEPLAYATNVAQGASTRLDHVLVTLATLHRTYSVESDVFDDPVASAALLKSLQKRWAALKTDQDVYLVAVFLNPYFRAFFFNDSDDAPHSLSRIGFYGLVKRVYKRVFRLEAGDDVPPELFSNYLQYYDGEGRFTKDKLGLDEFKQEYKGQVRLNRLAYACIYPYKRIPFNL
ncbi:ribonuclease H-like domain-containing protein [Mucidula mucida]|nr:ribonuclease H-like domain-containing protein [Mucidula mucida]